MGQELKEWTKPDNNDLLAIHTNPNLQNRGHEMNMQLTISRPPRPQLE